MEDFISTTTKDPTAIRLSVNRNESCESHSLANKTSDNISETATGSSLLLIRIYIPSSLSLKVPRYQCKMNTLDMHHCVRGAMSS